jgi:hypothetical protein
MNEIANNLTIGAGIPTSPPGNTDPADCRVRYVTAHSFLPIDQPTALQANLLANSDSWKNFIAIREKFDAAGAKFSDVYSKEQDKQIQAKAEENPSKDKEGAEKQNQVGESKEGQEMEEEEEEDEEDNDEDGSYEDDEDDDEDDDGESDIVCDCDFKKMIFDNMKAQLERDKVCLVMSEISTANEFVASFLLFSSLQFL